ncbi:TPR-like protein [Trichoderma velutinum]
MSSTTSRHRNIDNNKFGDNATLHQGDINNVFNYPQERRETPPQPFPLIPFSRDPNFVSRGDILDQISVRCLEPAGRVALVGLGGVGKSQLAIEFAHIFAEEHKDIWVFWIHAATRARVEEGFQLIADAIKLPKRKQPKADIPLLVRNWLSNEHNGRWIIILDSADNSDVLYSTDNSRHGKRSLAAYIPKSRNGSLVLTTRNRSLASKLTGGYKNIIEVGPMAETDALALLEKKMGSPLTSLDADLAQDLVKVLDYIPLAISQAAAYIQARGPRSSIKKYLVEFRRSERERLRLLKYEANDIRRDEEASNAVLKTWIISFDYIRSQQPSAADLLSFMSLFDRQGIPQWVLIDSRTLSDSQDSDEVGEESDEVGEESDEAGEESDDSDGDTNGRFEEDILILRNYCLIAVNEEGDEFEMHRLVQLSIKSWLKAFGLQETFMQKYITRMAAIFPASDYENWAICQDLFAHVQVALDYRPNVDTLEDWASLCYRGAEYAQEQGKYYLAEQMVNKSKRARERTLGKNDEGTLQNQGRWDEAEKLQAKVMETYRTKFEINHPKNCAAMDDLALTYCNQGRWDEAEKLQVQVIKVRRAVIGAKHPDTLTNRLDKAEKLQVQVVEARKIRLGADHPDTLSSMSNLASTYWNQDRLDEAEKLEVQILETRKTTIGADHPDTLICMHNLAVTWKDQMCSWHFISEVAYHYTPTHRSHLSSIFKASSMLACTFFIISSPTFFASANRGWKNSCVLTNRFSHVSKCPSVTHSAHPLAANVNSKSSLRYRLSSTAVLSVSSSISVLRKRCSVTPRRSRNSGVLQSMWS